MFDDAVCKKASNTDEQWLTMRCFGVALWSKENVNIHTILWVSSEVGPFADCY